MRCSCEMSQLLLYMQTFSMVFFHFYFFFFALDVFLLLSLNMLLKTREGTCFKSELQLILD